MISLSLANAAYGAAAVDALLFRCPREVRSYARASAAFWAAFALIYLARVALGIEWKAGEDWMAASSTVDSYAMVLLMMTLSGVAATEMLLLYGKVESTLRVTAAELKEINVELGSTQREIMITLSEIVEFRSKETASHVARVGEYSRATPLLCGRDRAEADLIGDAAPMHDIGKISIPDEVLNKSGAGAGRGRAYPEPHGRRLQAAGQVRAAPYQAGGGHRAGAPRALGGRRLPDREEGQGHLLRRPRGLPMRRLRRTRLGEALQGSLGPRPDPRVHPRPARRHVRPRAGGRLPGAYRQFRANFGDSQPRLVGDRDSAFACRRR